MVEDETTKPEGARLQPMRSNGAWQRVSPALKVLYQPSLSFQQTLGRSKVQELSLVTARIERPSAATSTSRPLIVHSTAIRPGRRHTLLIISGASGRKGIVANGSLVNSPAVMALLVIPSPVVWSYFVFGVVFAIGPIVISLRGD